MATNGWSKDNNIHIKKLAQMPPGEEIVISGIAGRFPETDNMNELWNNLIESREMVTKGHRWNSDHPRMPERTGIINDIEKFDALFFGIHGKQAHVMDPIARMLLEHTYEAIIDAGINPNQLRNTNTGVMIGICNSDTESAWFNEKSPANSYAIVGCSRAAMANRISYCFGLNGPSYAVDTACSSSFYAIEQAYRAINEGLCDAAIVGGGNLCLLPFATMQFCEMGVMSIDGRCKVFDESGNGYVRSEAVCVVFLQKAKAAKRVYATLVHAKTNCDGYKEQGLTYPSAEVQVKLLREFYLECGVPPSLVSYMEAHGTGTRAGDPEEVSAIDKALCEARPKDAPLLIGSVKSNLGHCEGACGIVSIAKVILAMENRSIPPNLYFKQCRQELRAILEGRIKVVNELTPWAGGHAGLNSLGFGGANAHLLLKSNDKEKRNGGAPDDDLPRLVVVSGRTEEAVSLILNDLESKPLDVEYVALLHNIHSSEVSNHSYRGYVILPARGIDEAPIKDVDPVFYVKRPVWLVFSGMGSQWPGMGEALLRIPVFAEAIEKCDAALKPYGINIYHVITNRKDTAFDNIIYSFIGIAAIQIGLVDILFSLGIKPDNVIGHSFGELGCAYADGCLTAEQTILSAYFRGLASVEAENIKGSMAAIGLGYKVVKNMCPSDIDVACHNSSESATISGPAKSVKKFVAELTAKNIFAREVACGNIAYHSRYIAGAGSKLLSYFKKVIPFPKIRSSKWVSTSVPKDRWDTESARYCSAEYHTNNFLSSVLFEETSAMIPKDAVTIEIAPHGLLQAILKRSLNSSVTNIGLAQRAHKNNVEVFLQAVGKMFNAGLHPQLANLYPPIEFPVSRSTPMISPLIKWDHSDDWYIVTHKSQTVGSGERVVEISVSDSKYESLAGHIIDGRNIFPGMGYLILIWETLGLMRGNTYTDISVVFEDVKFLRATILPKEKSIELTLMIQKGTGRFEVIEGDSALVTGFVRSTSQPKEDILEFVLPPDCEEELLDSKDVYKEFRIRGYQFTGPFRSITRASARGLRGHVVWQNDWIAFIDNILQIRMIGYEGRGLILPTAIKKLVIDSKAHYSQIEYGYMEKEFEVTYDEWNDVLTCSGVQISGIKANTIPRRKPAEEPVIEEYKFVPFTDKADVSLCEIARMSTHIALENHPMDMKVKTVELRSGVDKVPVNDLLSPWISDCLKRLPLLKADTILLTSETDSEREVLSENISVLKPEELGKDDNALLVVGYQLLEDEQVENLKLLSAVMKPDGFLLSREDRTKRIEDIAQSKGFHVILTKKCGKYMYVLLKRCEKLQQQAVVIKVNNEKFDWVDTMREAMSQILEKEIAENSRIFLVAQGDFETGLVGLVNCLRRELGGKFIRGIFIQDPKAPAFCFENNLYAEQVKKDLALNVLRENGVWGTYRHLPLATMAPKSVHHKYVKQLIPGDLSSLTWVEGPLNLELNGNNLVHVVYASLNFRDIMVASGKISMGSLAVTRLTQDGVLGSEYSGITNSGKRIMGVIKNHGLSNIVVPHETLSWEIPENWSFEDAATVPIAYGTCMYGLYMKGMMKKGDKILIHAGTGGVGQAAINLALAEGCEVFTTVGTPEKRQFILEHFPQIKDDHIGSSRDISFLNMIKKQTKGLGVDIVLNSLSEKKLLASVDCLGWGGRFLEIGKFDLQKNNHLGMECFLRGISFHGVMFDSLFDVSREAKLKFNKLVEKYIKNNAIKPLVRTVFKEEKIEEAFRYMAAGKHIGKVLFKVRNEEENLNSLTLALPQYWCLPDRSYIILGGLGGFGLELGMAYMVYIEHSKDDCKILADWMVLRGAKNLVLTSRTGIKNGYQKMRIGIWKSYGVEVMIISGKEASSYQDCRFILEKAASLAPIDGIFNLAAVLKDALWENQTPASFQETFKSKAWATTNLDMLTKKLCPQLRHFVVFSSMACGRGNPGQSNYAMANSVMERICERRTEEGLPGLAIQWGAIGDVGLVANMAEDNKDVVIGGTLQQRISSCLEVLDGFLQQKCPVVSSMVIAEKTSGKSVYLNIVQAVQNIIGLKDLSRFSANTSLTELGMDSMMAVEIKQTLEREFEIFLTPQDIRSLNFAKLQAIDEDNGINQKKRIDDKIPVEAKIISGTELVIRLIGNTKVSHEQYLKLRTKQRTNRSEIFFIPGIEGYAAIFDELAPKIKAPATSVQFGTCSFDSIFDIADDLLPRLLEKCQDSRTFKIVGYSFGCSVAIELARRLEAEGLNGQLILIDGAPNQSKAILSQALSTQNNDMLENKCLLLILKAVSPSNADNEKFEADLKRCNTLQQKVQALAEICPYPISGLTPESYEDFCISLCKKIIASINHDASLLKPIKAPITLLKPTIPSLKMDTEDYGLSKLTIEPVKIHYVKGNHHTMIDDVKTALVINEELDED